MQYCIYYDNFEINPKMGQILESTNDLSTPSETTIKIKNKNNHK